ncbi:hypothetical protein CA831_32795, partial [Burkholderia multivorans]
RPHTSAHPGTPFAQRGQRRRARYSAAQTASTAAPAAHMRGPGNAACRCSTTTPSANAIHHPRIPPPCRTGAALAHVHAAPCGNDYADESARRGSAASALAEVDRDSACASM